MLSISFRTSNFDREHGIIVVSNRLRNLRVSSKHQSCRTTVLFVIQLTTDFWLWMHASNNPLYNSWVKFAGWRDLHLQSNITWIKRSCPARQASRKRLECSGMQWWKDNESKSYTAWRRSAFRLSSAISSRSTITSWRRNFSTPGTKNRISTILKRSAAFSIKDDLNRTSRRPVGTGVLISM